MSISCLVTRTRVGRGPYLILGVVLFNIKHCLDNIVYHIFYKTSDSWRLFDYMFPFKHIGQRELTDLDIWFFSILFLIAVPFVYLGIGLTIRRLRALQLPLWISIFFFVPMIKFIFFFIVSTLPSKKDTDFLKCSDLMSRILDRIVPESPMGSALAAILINSIVAFIGVSLGVSILKQYGMSLFVAGPFALGMIAAIIHGYHGNRTLGGCIAVAIWSIVILCVILIAFAVEGLLCIIMMLPLVFFIAISGAWVGYYIQIKPISKIDSGKIMMLLFFLIPVFMGFEYAKKPEPTLFAVKTHVDIKAPIGTVWKNVIEFPSLPEPKEALFKAGISYPINAKIKGQGVGAVRYCNFSTGSFVEPITVWDENKLLKFDVVDQPIPMKELSPYKLDTPHLDGYMVSRKGQFLLTQLSDGTIRLEGTTWYTNKMWPEGYWKMWSDYVIHQIHLRVLNHIRNVSEGV